MAGGDEAVSRTEKIFHRLDELEAEYLRLVHKEFEGWLQGRWSRFLARMYDVRPWGKYWQNEGHAHLLCLEKEIEALRMKLDQPLAESPVGAVQELFGKLKEEKRGGSGSEYPLVREFLKRWTS